MIAEAGGLVSCPVHSSVSGTVKAIDTRKNAMDGQAEAVIVENDGKDESVPFEAADAEKPGPSCRGLICIEDNKPKAIESMRKAVAAAQGKAAGGPEEFSGAGRHIL